MRIPVLLALLFTCLISTLPAHSQTWLAATRSGGSFEEQSRSIGIDAAGNSYITGFFVEQTVFGGVTTNAYGNDGTDIFIAKYNSAGALQWMKRAGGFEDDFGYDLEVDAAGNFYLIGHFQSTATFGSLSVTSAGVYDVFVAKYNTNGDVQWVQRYGGSSTDFGHSIALDPSGNIFIAGGFMGTSTFGTTTLVSAGSTDTYVAKLDPLGNVLWAKRGGGILSENVYQLATDPSGNVIITGTFMHTATFDAVSVTSAGNTDIFVAKYSSTGALQWLKTAGNFREDAGLAVGTDALGNVYASGFYQESISFDGMPLTNSGNYDTYLVKYSPTGVVQWVQRGGGTLYDAAWGLHVEPNGEAYMSGYFQGTAMFGSMSLSSSGAQDIFVTKYSAAGTPQWVKSAGGPQYDLGFDLKVDASGNTRVTGFISATASFSPFTLVTAGVYDVYVAKLSPGCSVLADAGADVTVCSGQSAAIGSAAQPGHTYSWSVTPSITGFSSTQSALSVTMPAVTVPTQFTFTQTVTVAGCPALSDAVVVTVNPSPVVLVNPAPAAICAGSSLQLTASGADTYTWTAAPGLSATSGAVVTASPTVSTTYSVVGTLAGCTGAATAVPVTVNAIPAAPAASNSGPVCMGNALSLSASTISGATYSWVGPGSFSAATQIATVANSTAASAGTYTVYAIVNGCISDAAVTAVSVEALPGAPLASSSGPVCSGSALQLSASGVANATYSWEGPAGFVSTDQFPLIGSTSTANTGLYSVFAVSALGCASAPGTVSVTITPTPVAIASNTGPICNGSSLQLLADTVAGATYSWTGPNTFSSNQQSPLLSNVTAATSGEYTLTVSANGCTGVAYTHVFVNQVIPAPLISTNGPVCEGGLLVLTAPAAPGTTYFWAGPGGFTSGDQEVLLPNATQAMAGQYSLSVVVNGCSSLVSTTTVAVNAPAPAPTAIAPAQLCQGQTLQLSAGTVSGAVSYSWSGPAGFSSAQQDTSLTNISAANSGTYTAFSLVPGCSPAFDTVTVTIFDLPAVTASAGNSNICSGASTMLSAAGANSYTWSPGTGLSGTTGAVVSASPGASQVYTVTGEINGCSNTATVAITVAAPPTAAITATSDTIGTGSATQLQVQAGGTGPFTYSWSPAAGLSNTGIANPTASPGSTTTYTVTVTDLGTGCTTTAAITITVLSAPGAVAAQGLGLQVFPNPFSEAFSVVVSSQQEQVVQLTLLDATGRIIEKRTHKLLAAESTFRYELDAGYSNGLYLVLLQSGNQQLTARVMRQR